jgi:hypothetical protein
MLTHIQHIFVRQPIAQGLQEECAKSEQIFECRRFTYFIIAH